MVSASRRTCEQVHNKDTQWRICAAKAYTSTQETTEAQQKRKQKGGGAEGVTQLSFVDQRPREHK